MLRSIELYFRFCRLLGIFTFLPSRFIPVTVVRCSARGRFVCHRTALQSQKWCYRLCPSIAEPIYMSNLSGYQKLKRYCRYVCITLTPSICTLTCGRNIQHKRAITRTFHHLHKTHRPTNRNTENNSKNWMFVICSFYFIFFSTSFVYPGCCWIFIYYALWSVLPKYQHRVSIALERVQEKKRSKWK